MNLLTAALAWSVVMGLCWIAALSLIACVLLAQPAYALFSVALGGCALALSVGLVREGGR